MTVPNLIPTLDPNPLPAPYWIFEVLLLVTFFLHILAMNCMLGSATLALVAKWGPGRRKNGNHMFSDITKKLPVLLPAVITLGVAPLLFVQVLYGQFFYTSSIIVAWPWFLVLILLASAYYGFYFVSYRNNRRPGRTEWVLLMSVVFIFIIAFMFSNVITLSQTPARWGAKYFADPAGWNLNLTEPTLIPRYLHFMTAAVAVGGIFLVLMAWARWKKDPEYARDVFYLGGKTFIYATTAEFAVGLWFLIALPRRMSHLFMGGNPLATILLGIGIAGAIAAIILMSRALRNQNIRLAGYSVVGIMGIVILSMVVMREILRLAYLQPYFHPEQFAVKTQWSVFLLFLVIFLAGVALWLVMLKRYGLFACRKLPEQPSL
jgi:hypothetical protein